MKRVAALLLLVVTPLFAAEDPKLQETIKALEAATQKDPANLPYLYILATYYDKAKDADGVVRTLQRLIDLNWEHGLARDQFRNTDTIPFRNAAISLHAREPKVLRSKRAFILKNRRDLVPEGIAYDPVDDVFYLSGIYRRNVLRVSRDGKTVTDFVKEAQDGMLGGLGLKVDAKRRRLWVISSTTPEMRGWKEGEDRSMLAAYDLKTGKLLKKVEATPALLNDLVLFDDGSLFATDMGRHNVMRLAPDGDKLEIFASDFGYPNGIAAIGNDLYVADFRGLTKLDARDAKKRTRIESKALLNGIDGLVVHDGKLVGIQNAIGRARVIRIDPATGAVENLESRNPLFEIPTTAAVAGDELYFIANPGLRSFNEDHTLWPEDKLEDPVMLRLPLR
ncbi:MAG: SMP-30/gluconolactonase/LRE family protein [Thermoanaerobaculia bacterium]